MKKLTIEQTLQRLDEIMEELESDDKDLKEILSLYEEGMTLIKQSKELLDEAELKVKLFQNNQLVDFDEEEHE